MTSYEEMRFTSERLLEFGYRQQLDDPRDGLFLFGPLADERKPSEMRVGVVGTPRGLALYRSWVEAANGFIPSPASSSVHHIPFPGFEATFRANWSPSPVVEIAISANEVASTIRGSSRHKAIFDTVTLFEEPIQRRLREDDLPIDLWFVVIPDEVWRLGRPLSRPSRAEVIYSADVLGARFARRLLKEPSLFPEDMEAAQVYRFDLNFHHQLKARLLRARAVIQVVRESSLSFGEEQEGVRRRLQDPATLTWNLCTTAFFKAGGRPWKLADVRQGVCYVGLAFKTSDTDPTSGNACCGAQMFLDSGDGLVFKGAIGPWHSSQTHEFHLPEVEARNLMKSVLRSYIELHGAPPSEMFIHGRTRFDDNEWRGFSSAVPPETRLVGVRIVRSQDMKVFRPGRTPVLRGSSFHLGWNRALLWTTGYIPQLSTYPGREVPNPLYIEVCRGEADLDTVLNDVLGLTKVNFNSCIFADGLPVTLRFADAVGEILTAAPGLDGPPLPFRHYI